MSGPRLPASRTLRLLAGLGAAAALACTGEPPFITSGDIAGIYAGTLATTGVCGSGTLTATIFEGGQNLYGTWTTTGFATTAPCALDASGTASGAVVGTVVYLTLTANAQEFRLVGTYVGGTITGTFTQTFSSGPGVSPGGTFSIAR